MTLLKVRGCEKIIRNDLGLLRYSAWVDLSQDSNIHSAVLAANINILRRTAPILYLLSNGYTNTSWRAEDIGDNDQYLQSLDSSQLGRGITCYPPDGLYNGTSVITGILCGDILPFVHLLSSEDFFLICLPNVLSLQTIDETILASSSNIDAIKLLLSSGGCAITVIDSVRLALWTMSEFYGRYFQCPAIDT